MGSYSQDKADPLAMLQNHETAKLIENVVQSLPSHAKVLFVGCKESLPIISRLSSAGHDVHGIDRSRESVTLASSQVLGHFEQADETEYQPEFQFDAVFAILSLYHLSRAQTYSLVFQMSDWLKPRGTMILATTLSDHLATSMCRDRVDDCVRDYTLQLNGNPIRSTLYSHEGWITLCEKAGLSRNSEAFSSVQVDAEQPPERYTFMSFRKTVQHAILGPYPLPESYRGPISLSEAAWKPFAERLVRDEFEFVLKVLENNQQVLDVGSGYGRLPIEVAARTGKAYSIEPNADRNSIQAATARNSGVEIAEGSAEQIPYPDRRFDAVVAMWVMHYVEDLERSLRELVRVTDPTAPHSRIVLAQGAPENELIDLMNTVCAPVSASNQRPNHQGYLLHKAVEIFTKCGFGDISLHRVDAYCEFLEEDLTTRCEKAAEVVAGLWCLGDGNFESMKQALIPRLMFNFKDRPHAIGDQVAVLVAKPGVAR